MNLRKPSDKLKLLDEYVHQLVKRFYLGSSREGLGANLSGSELFACNLLGRKGKCTMSQLAQECDLALSSTTAVVDRLIAKGCVKRNRDDGQDRRRVFVQLDWKGEKIYQELLESEMQTIITMMDALTPQEQETLLDTLGKAVASLEK